MKNLQLLLRIGAIMFAVVAIGVLLDAKSAIHEILALIIGLNSTACVATLALMESIKDKNEHNTI